MRMPVGLLVPVGAKEASAQVESSIVASSGVSFIIMSLVPFTYLMRCFACPAASSGRSCTNVAAAPT
eukprot:8664851-Prorocentrum_lima.AAC.1